MSNKTNFNYGPPMADFMGEVQKIIVQQPDFKGIGGHGPSTHNGTHPLHSQVSIGMGNQTVNFRKLD